MENRSGLKAVGRAVLCKPYSPEINNSPIAVPDHVKAMEFLAEMRAVVVQVGEHCWPDEPARARAGDKVLVSKFSGAIVKGTADGELYRLVNDNDIFCQIEVGGMDNVLVKDPIMQKKQLDRPSVLKVR